MRIWLHTTTRSSALAPSGAVSILAHAALIGGAVYGTGKASHALEQAVAERIYYLPPPDRMPSSRPVAQRVRYVVAGAGVPREATGRTGTVQAGAGGQADVHSPEQAGADEQNQLARAAIAAGDSVYSILNVEEGATRIEGSGAPIYPPALLEQHVEGSVRARYVIDSTGSTEPASIEILTGTHPEFVQSVRQAIPQMRFNPGMIAGRRIRQLVEQSFLFHILTPPPAAADHTRALPVP